MHCNKVRRAVGWVGLVSLGIAGAVHASAPVDQYKWFSLGSTAIEDTKTGLRWVRSYEAQKKHDEADDYCNTLVIVSELGSESGWRLPTVKELLTLVDEQPRAVYVGGMLTYPTIDSNAFPDTPRNYFWSATANPKVLDEAWVVNFGTGDILPLNTDTPVFVRCVKNK